MFPPILGVLLVLGAVALVLAAAGLAVTGVLYALLSMVEYLAARFRAIRGEREARVELDCRLQTASVTVAEDGGVEVTLRFRSEPKGAALDVIGPIVDRST